jgi:formylglycine-generating enzyme required for sulfatase activity
MDSDGGPHLIDAYAVPSRDGSMLTNPLSTGAECPDGMLVAGTVCLDRTEVTVAEYRTCVEQKLCVAPDTRFTPFCNWGRKDRDRHPMNCVSFIQALDYCHSRVGRLPTGDEWEIAAAGALGGQRYPWGEVFESRPQVRVNACDRSCSRLFGLIQDYPTVKMFQWNDGWDTTAPVGSYLEGISPLGFLDMAGNVAEWTVGEKGPVVRGGSWHDYNSEALTTTKAIAAAPEIRSAYVGFRCAR